MSRKRWRVAQCDKQTAISLAQECGIDALVALILTGRGICDPFEIDEMLSPDQALSDPFDMADMDRAVERINRAIEQNERIAVYGDYDADGVTSTAMLYTYLTSRGADVIYAIPERSEGYGMNMQTVDAMKERGVRLIVTVDNGIGAHDEIEYASRLGIDTIVTDHHLASDTLPQAVAVVDPHRADDVSEYKNYAGAGVAFKLICALEGCTGEELIPEYGALAAVGTVADVMPLTGDNRLIVSSGVKHIPESVGLNCLLKAASLDKKEIGSSTVSFGLAPRLNAAGRVGMANRAVRLLLETDAHQAQLLADEINADNARRQTVERSITEEAVQIIEEQSMMYDRIIVVYSPQWHHGVIGIVAARICERYGRPVIILSDDGEYVSGSARSVGDFSIYDAIKYCEQLLVKFGGHSQAAGVTLDKCNIDRLRERINAYAADRYESMPFDTLDIDCKLNPGAFTPDMVESLEVLAPFGCGNPAPVFGLFGMRLDRIVPVGDRKHLRLDLSKNGVNATVMLFSRTEKQFGYAVGSLIDLAVSADINEYGGRVGVTLTARAVRAFGVDEQSLLEDIRIYERIKRGEDLTEQQKKGCAVTRDDVAAVYKAVRRNPFSGEEEAFMQSVGGLSLIKLRLVLDVLEELGLITCDRAAGVLAVSAGPVSEKMQLTQSATYKLYGGVGQL